MKVDDLLKEKRICKNDIQIWGGEIKEEELKEFLQKWSLSGMPYRIVETVRDIKITQNDIMDIEPEEVERIRIFGEEGDLDIRRDSSSFKWRSVGKIQPPQGIRGENFWEKNHDKKFFMEEKEALLWGKYAQNMKLWHDSQVARAKLLYPVGGKPEKVKIKYKILSEKGAVSFVWLTEIRGNVENG